MSKSLNGRGLVSRGMGRRTALAAGGALLAFPAIHARAAGNGVALVIGNSKYQWEAQLPNVRRDAPDVAKRFQAFGLQTDLQMDLTRDGMRAAFDRFSKVATGADFSAIYFAGHGASFNRESYIVPIDADLTDPSAVSNLLALSSIRRGMGKAKHRLIALDACRNNPADGWRQADAMQGARGKPTANAEGGESPVNGLILFSTAPGRIALDGPSGQNSPFCSAFMRQFDSGSVEIQSMPGRLRRDLLIATQGRQVVWDQSTYKDPFTLAGAAGAGAATGSGAGWGADPSKIIELPKTYAYAAQNGISLPAGFIAHHPAGKSRDSMKIGGYKYASGKDREPAILIVMSVEEGQTAEVITAGRFGDGTVSWRFVRATLSGDTLEFVPALERPKQSFRWSGAAGGTVGFIPTTATTSPGQGAIRTTPFERLDG